MSQFRGGDESPDPAQRTLDRFLWNTTKKDEKSLQTLGKEENGEEDEEERMDGMNSDIEAEDLNHEEEKESWRQDDKADEEELSADCKEEEKSHSKRPLDTHYDGEEERKKPKPTATDQKTFLSEQKREKDPPSLLLPAPVATTMTSITNDKRFECPICTQLISALSTLQFQMHVERCLELMEKKTESVRPPSYAAAIKKPAKKKKQKIEKR
jgi:hypothetical protein